MSTDFIERPTSETAGQSASDDFPYLGKPTTCDGAKGGVWGSTPTGASAPSQGVGFSR